MDFRKAVEKTITYSAYFYFPLSPQEIYFWLISSQPVPLSSIKKYLPVLSKIDTKTRKTLLKNSKEKEKKALQFVKIARKLPWIRLIALTGSVAINNSKTDDDLDLLIITSAHTLWLVRPLILILLSTQFSRRHPNDDSSNTSDAFCPNLWLDTLSLSVPTNRRNIYTAHEVLQIKPLYNKKHAYQNFLSSNSWVGDYLANAYQILSNGKSYKDKPSISTFFLIPLNYLMYFLQYIYMLPKKTIEAVSYHSAYFHKNDLSNTLTNHLKKI